LASGSTLNRFQHAYTRREAHNIEADSRPVPSADPPADLLLQAVTNLNAEFLVLGAYGTPRLKEFFLGSVTKSLLKQSPFPLFLFH
jgi:nucleotide-binding universal stress UspA family protein